MSLSAAMLLAGRYRLGHRIAIDRYGEVWRGTDIELARPVAVKLLGANVADAETVSQFRAVACRAAALAHEGLVRVFDYCEPSPSDGAQPPFMVMELVDGQSLADLIRAESLGPDRAIDIVAQVSAALLAMHRAALAHGDVRPDKILLSRDGAAKLFGFSGMSAAGSAAIGADLCALGALARDCGVSERTGSAGELIADLCACESANSDTTAAFARRAAALREQPRRPVAPRRGPAPPPGRAVPDSTQPLPAFRPSAVRARVVAVRTAGALAIAVAAVAIYGAFKPTSTAPNADRAAGSAVTSIRVDAARMIGQPVNAVRFRLRRLGLVTRVRWRASDSVKAGEVIAVRPTGLVPVHSIVVIVGSTGWSATNSAPGVGMGPNSHHKRRRSPSHSPATTPSTPGPSHSPSTSPTPSPSPSPSSSSPAPSPSPTGSPSPSASSSPPNPLPSSTPPFPDRLLAG